MSTHAHIPSSPHPYPQTPPPRLTNRSISTWDSPFSDYYTDPSASSPYPDLSSPYAESSYHGGSPFTPNHPNSSQASNQQSLLRRLALISAAVSAAAPGAQATAFLEKRLEQLETVLEAALAAPETQSREPADGGESGLFVDDEDEEGQEGLAGGEGDRESESADGQVDEADVEVSVEREVMADQALKEAQEVVARITKVATELRLRYEEVKHISSLSSTRLATATTELHRLRTENETLRSALSVKHADVLALELQIKTLEIQAVNGELSACIEGWTEAWKDEESGLGEESERDGVGDGNGGAAAVEEEEEEEEEEKEKKNSIEGDSDLRKDPAAAEYGELVVVDEAMHLLAPALAARSSVKPTPSSISSHDGDKENAAQAEGKTPWQELWDSLTEFVGMSDYD